jgi:CRISPR/Cas system-associated endonuclease/helicase Cas3
MWGRHFLGAETRVYQTLILRDEALRKVLRAGRRLGKTFSMALYLIHYSYTHKDGRSLVIAPMKTQVELIYQEILRLASKNEIVSNSITRKVTSPQFMIQFSNGSTIRFFTSLTSNSSPLSLRREILSLPVTFTVSVNILFPLKILSYWLTIIYTENTVVLVRFATYDSAPNCRK